jgi:CBS domain-containing protein
MRNGELCVRNVVIAPRDLAVIAAAKRMREEHVGALVVTDRVNGREIPVGIVTDRDLVMEILAAEIDPAGLTVGEVMSNELLTIHEEEHVWTAIRIMREAGVRRIPVVDSDDGLVGILSLDDTLGLLSYELGELVKLVHRERKREEKTRPA